MTQALNQDPGTIAWTNDTNADVDAGDLIDLGGRVGIAAVDIADEATGTVLVRGIFRLAKDTSTFSQHDVAYWGVDDENLTSSPATGDPRVGEIVTAAATGVTYAQVEINVPETAGRQTEPTFPASGAGDATVNQSVIESLITAMKAAGIYAN